MVVTELEDETFHARLGVEGAAGAFELSVRPSDGIAVALRAGVPIEVVPEVLDLAGIELIRTPDTPFTDEEVDTILSEFRSFLSTANPEDFDRPADDGPDGDDAGDDG